MGRDFRIFNALSAGAPCLLACPGIFSGLSNDGRHSPALIIASVSQVEFGLLAIARFSIGKVAGKRNFPGAPACPVLSQIRPVFFFHLDSLLA